MQGHIEYILESELNNEQEQLKAYFLQWTTYSIF